MLEHGRIKTTLPKAKELRIFVEKEITRAIHVGEIVAKPLAERSREEQARLVHAIRVAARLVRTKDVLTRLFYEIAPALKGRPGGYTRIVKTAPRVGDGAPLAIIEIILPEATVEAA